MSESSVALSFTVSRCSAHSGKYVAKNILVDNPSDQSSRWSGAYQGNAKQWIILRLERLAVLSCVDLLAFASFVLTELFWKESITFGKVNTYDTLSHELTDRPLASVFQT
jgi:hypothetical protein